MLEQKAFHKYSLHTSHYTAELSLSNKDKTNIFTWIIMLSLFLQVSPCWCRWHQLTHGLSEGRELCYMLENTLYEQGSQLTDFNVHRWRKMQLKYQTAFKWGTNMLMLNFVFVILVIPTPRRTCQTIPFSSPSATGSTPSKWASTRTTSSLQDTQHWIPFQPWV